MRAAPILAASILAALLLAACGSGAGDTASRPGTAPMEPDPASMDEAVEPVSAFKLLDVLDDLPTQDELDAAAAARISEATADAEYEQLKAEIDADLASAAEDG